MTKKISSTTLDQYAGITRRRTAAEDKWWALEGVCGKVYKTKAALVDDIRSINNGAPLNEPLCTLDRSFLINVLKHHYDWQAKRGAGIAHIEVRMNPSHTGSTRGLWVTRLDGSEVDISWVVALKPGGQSSAKENVCAAARREIFDQVLAARTEQDGKCCPMCGEPLLRKTHVDHAAPNTFDSILTGFLHAYGHSYESIGVDDFGTYSMFENRALAADWQDYHVQLADLRLIHAHENLSLGRQL